MLLPVFESMLLGTFALVTLAVGVFTAYFGAGKSRRVGVALTLLGLVAGLVFASLTLGLFPEIAEGPWAWEHVLTGIVAVLGAAAGTVIAVLLFLASIMRA